MDSDLKSATDMKAWYANGVKVGFMPNQHGVFHD